MPFKKPKKKYKNRGHKPRTDWDDPEDLWVLDMSLPMDEWEFTRVKNG